MILVTWAVCPMVSPIAGKTLQCLLRSSGRRHTSGQVVAALRGGSRRWWGHMGEMGLTAEPWGPLARQGMFRGSICCQEDLRRPLHVHAAEEWREQGAVEQGRKAAWNKPEPGWGKLEDVGGKTFGGFTGSTWPAAAWRWEVKKRGSECDSGDYNGPGWRRMLGCTEGVDRKILASLATRLYVTKENCWAEMGSLWWKAFCEARACNGFEANCWQDPQMSKK